MTDRVTPGAPFTVLPVPGGVEVLRLACSVGTLTALRARPAGTGHGTALLVPGFTGSKEDFLDLLPLLADHGWDAWAFSQRGQGDSAAPEGESAYTRELFAADAVEVARLVRAATGAGPLHLLGHSFGGTVAQAAALAAPGEFADLVLLCSGPHGWPGRKAAEEDRLRAAGKRTDLWTLDNPERAALDPAELGLVERFVRERSRHTSVDNLLGAIAVLRDPEDHTLALAATGLPVLVAHGVRDSDAWPQPWQRRSAELLGGRYAVIPDAGHLPNQENPAATAALLSG
ncbi:alpha/beta hydrolase, partial [Amycolatopsis rhizosphaerae]